MYPQNYPQFNSQMSEHMYGGEFHSPEYILIKLLGFLIFLFILVVILRRWRDHGHILHCGCNDSAMTMLREKYVKGEIDKSEFHAKRKDLMN